VGVCAATSFYPTKNLGAFGDGGALLTDSEEIAAKARQLRDYGQASKYIHASIGYNSRLDELHAAILGRVFLPLLNGWTSQRRSIASRYLGGIRNPVVLAAGAPAGSESSWHLFPVLVPHGRKAEFMRHLAAWGIRSGEHYPMVMADQPAMKELAHREAGACAVARDFCQREVSLPIHPYLCDEEISRVIDACNGWAG
jgi:dTDP-4-amino-4,6-dideoxygalactose transaminase